MRMRTISKDRLAGGVVLGAVASGLAAAALSGAGTADATCAWFSGVGNGGGCTSTPTSFAIGLGTRHQIDGHRNVRRRNIERHRRDRNSQRHRQPRPRRRHNSVAQAGFLNSSSSVFNVAAANGTNAFAGAVGTGNVAVAIGNPGNNNGFSVTKTFPGGSETLEIIAGPNQATDAQASGTFNRAFSVGNGSFAIAEGGDPTKASIGNNTALALGNGSNALAFGTPAFGGWGPNNQFAAALGNNKNALNGINNG
ncbi:MAG: hypothetical protein JO280_11375 [Mycobacteriaceae bacterium]|nr:hypothetical protein [Mycobacteriaceae bacterium]